jgi:YceI-like domain
MPTFDAHQIECRVFTFKEGALAAIAHDLELRVTRLRLELSEGGPPGGAAAVAPTYKLSASFEAGSLIVLHAVDKLGNPTDQLSPSDRRKIEKTIISEVLDVKRHPEIRFEATAAPAGEGFTIAGELTLEGKRRALTLTAQPQRDRMVVEATVHQPDFGIRPYTAMLGTLKIRPDVKVRISMAWPMPAA